MREFAARSLVAMQRNLMSVCWAQYGGADSDRQERQRASVQEDIVTAG